MASDEDKETLIECFRPRLRELIPVEQVLDLIHFIQADRRELIRQKLASEGNSTAVDYLINEVKQTPHPDGWFQTFVDALRESGCLYAADCMQQKLPDPEVEKENDYCVLLIRLLAPSLNKMKTDQVAEHCFSRGLLTNADNERVQAETTNKGFISGASELLRRIERGRPGWFSDFVQILRETGHEHLSELTGGPPDEQDEKKCLMKDQRAADGAACVESLEAGETSETSETNETSQTQEMVCSEESPNEATDLASNDVSISPERPQPDGSDVDGAAASPKRNIELRGYQMEVAKPALEGKNIIICLPTGSGKTRVAVYITKQHLDHRREEGKRGKVVVLVNKIPLVEQHFREEFLPFLKQSYKVARVSGDSQLKISFTAIVQQNDVIVCTAQILENFLERAEKGEDEGVKLSDLTLIVVDECHHTQKGGVYNHIMMRYLKQKHKNKRLKKEQKEPSPLPQILGLTASPGVDGATKMEKAVAHILSICANLDASNIMTANLGEFRKEQRKKIVDVEDRKADPFGDVIKKIMADIQTHADLSPTCELGTQSYELWIGQQVRHAERDGNQKVRVCADHLLQYNLGLSLCNTIRMCDALNNLNKYYEGEKKSKTSPDKEHEIQITPTERFLFQLFEDNKQKLETLAKNPDYENDSLSKLREAILREFSTRTNARGIIFTKTRLSAIALNQWVEENSKFSDIGVKSAFLMGGGDQSHVKPMTSAEQKEVLTKFGNGKINLLIATTVAEEGLDIPACNFVIRYGLVTNEIAMMQAKGRGRADDSSYTLIEVKNSGVAEKEVVNEYRISMMDKAIEKIRALKKEDYNRKITECQIQAIMENKVRTSKDKKKSIKSESPSDVKFSCRGCSSLACSGEDVRIIENMHRVNVTPQFAALFIRKENTSLQERFLDYETNGYIACKHCGARWGSMMMFKGIECPSLHVKNFVVNVSGKNINRCSQWNEVPIKFQPFDYIEHAAQMAQSSDDDETS